jgi:hypothetical protein
MYKDKLRKPFRKMFDGEAAAAPARKERLRTVLRLEELEPRCCPSPLTGGGTGVIWDPQAGTPNYNWSYGPNWQNGVAPAPGVTAIFDGRYNLPCDVDINTSNPIVLQNGYTATMTIQNGITMGITGYQDVNIGADNWVLAFAAPNAVEDFTAGWNFLGDFSWGRGGKNVVDGGSVYIGMQSGLAQSTASPLILNGGGVYIGPFGANSGTSQFDLTNGSADINVNASGMLQFSMPTTLLTTLVSNMGTSAWINNNGTVNLVNIPGGGSAKIAAPLENHGTLNANQGGIWNFTAADSSGNDINMNTGKITMAGGVNLSCNDGYKQSGGTLEIADNKTEMLQVLPPGTANFNGGKIVFDSATGYGILALRTVIFNGVEIDMRIDGTGVTSDQIQVAGAGGGNSVTIQGNSTLVVTAVNAVNAKKKWTLITPGAGNTIGGDFAAGNITLPNGVKETPGALPNSWQCNS